MLSAGRGEDVAAGPLPDLEGLLERDGESPAREMIRSIFPLASRVPPPAERSCRDASTRSCVQTRRPGAVGGAAGVADSSGEDCALRHGNCRSGLGHFAPQAGARLCSPCFVDQDDQDDRPGDQGAFDFS